MLVNRPCWSTPPTLYQASRTTAPVPHSATLPNRANAPPPGPESENRLNLFFESGPGDGTRTRDVQLGNLNLD